MTGDWRLHARGDLGFKAGCFIEDPENSKFEIDVYLEDGLIKHEANGGVDSFKILQWWKDRESKKTFSTGGQILNDSRSSLKPSIVEALVCLEDWVKKTGDQMHEVLVKIEK